MRLILIDVDDFELRLKNSCNTDAEANAFVNFFAYLDEQPVINEWVPCSDRLPTEEECAKQGNNLFEVTMVVRNKFRVTDYCLLHTDYKTWHVKDDCEVVAWKYKTELYVK